MTSYKYISCSYCSTNNPALTETCQACGAPIKSKIQEIKDESVITPLSNGRKTQRILSPELGEKVDDVYFTFMNTYRIAWRTVGEAVAIAAAGLIIGISGGTTGMSIWGILGGGLVGTAVGLTRKSFLWVIFSAPAGSILGLFIGGLSWIAGVPELIVFSVIIISILAAVLGGKRKQKYQSQNWWEKSRPFIGAAGGLAFAVLGVIIGIGIKKLLTSF